MIWLPGEDTGARPLARFLDWRVSRSIGPSNRINDAGGIIVDTDASPTKGAYLRPQAPPPGDVDGDCVANLTDLLLVIVEFGRNDGPADLDGDGSVDGFDRGIVLSNWQ